MRKKVTVLGGGISGLSLAWKLAESGLTVEVIEAEKYIGGLAATINNNGHKMDFGPHSLFSEDDTILKTIINLFENGIPAGKRNVKLYMDGKYLRYPLNAEDILMKLGIGPSIKCFVSYVREKLRKEPDFGLNGPNMEQWSTRQFGKELHELFFKPYTEQFWNVSCDKLSPNCIPSYKQMSFFKTLKLLVTPKKFRGNIDIIDREMLPFYYPEDGFGSIASKISEKIVLNKGNINIGKRVIEIRRLENGTFVVKAQDQEGETLEFESDYLVSTLPIFDFIKILSPEAPTEVKKAADNLRYLSLLILYLATDKTNILDCMYEYCLEKPFNRLTDINNFTLVPDHARKSNMLSIEQSCNVGDKWWHKSKEDLFNTFIPFLEAEGIIKKSEVTDVFLLKVTHAYPMYLYGYTKFLTNYKNYVDSIPNLRVAGRAGIFKYMDIDQCMKLAFDLADELIKTIHDS